MISNYHLSTYLPEHQYIGVGVYLSPYQLSLFLARNKYTRGDGILQLIGGYITAHMGVTYNP